MTRVVFLLEEYSLKALLEGLLPRLFPGLPFHCVSHEGKQDLEKSIPRKLRAWREPGNVFVVVRDNDRGDCRANKLKLAQLAAAGGREDTLIRLACQEIESWYLGDPVALGAAYPGFDSDAIARKPRFQDPDAVDWPSRLLQQHIPEFQKVGGARLLAKFLSRENRSQSYRVFLAGIAKLAGEIKTTDDRWGGGI